MNEPTTMESAAQSMAEVATAQASRYLQQLCKHFAHRLTVTFTPQAGEITFPSGTCRLKATDDRLTLSLEAADDAQLLQLQDVVERHLVRFAFREELKLAWQRTSAAAPR